MNHLDIPSMGDIKAQQRAFLQKRKRRAAILAKEKKAGLDIAITVQHSITRKPVAGAKITSKNLAQVYGVTSVKGKVRFMLQGRPGVKRTIVISKRGYGTVTREFTIPSRGIPVRKPVIRLRPLPRGRRAEAVTRGVPITTIQEGVIQGVTQVAQQQADMVGSASVSAAPPSQPFIFEAGQEEMVSAAPGVPLGEKFVPEGEPVAKAAPQIVAAPVAVDANGAVPAPAPAPITKAAIGGGIALLAVAGIGLALFMGRNRD